MEKDKDGSAQEASPSPSDSRDDFVRDGEMFTWIKPGTLSRQIKLHNRRVRVGHSGNKYYLFFKMLISVKERQISVSKLAISKEAAEALYMLLASYIHPQLASFVTSASESVSPPGEPSQSPPVTPTLPTEGQP